MITVVWRNDEHKKNWAFAGQLNDAARSEGISPFAGKTVGVLHQRVVAVGTTMEEVNAQLDELCEDVSDAAWWDISVEPYSRM